MLEEALYKETVLYCTYCGLVIKVLQPARPRQHLTCCGLPMEVSEEVYTEVPV